MTFRQALTARLLADAPLAALVATRIYWGLRPRNGPLPAITLAITSDSRPRHLKGFDGARWTGVQADCWADTQEEAEAIADAFIAAVAEPVTIEGKRFGHAEINNNLDLSEAVQSGIGAGSGSEVIKRQMVDCRIRHKGD